MLVMLVRVLRLGRQGNCGAVGVGAPYTYCDTATPLHSYTVTTPATTPVPQVDKNASKYERRE